MPLRRDTSSIALPLTFIVLSIAARLVSLQGLHPLNWDEIEFFRATDWVRQGLVPYRDFWEHHTPLQWFLFAPVTALTHSPGADAIILMRWAQLPLWMATFWLLSIWMRDAGIERWARWSAMAVALTSSVLMLPAVEYRVDVLAGTLFVLALVCGQRTERATAYAVGAGAAFCLAGFANLRLGPVLAIAMLAFALALRGRRAAWMFAGAAVTFALCAAYFVITGSIGIAVRRLWTENYLADRFAQNVPGIFLHRVLAPFGIRIVQFEGVPPFGVSAIDPGGIVLMVFGAIGLLRAVRNWRAPDAWFVLAIVQAANIFFIASMKFVFNYHLEIAAVLMVPFVAGEFARIRNRQIVLAVLCVTTVMNVAVALFRGKEADTAYQNLIMREVDRHTPAGAPVWDSAGWAIRRPPAYRYWFLRMIVTVLEERGYFEHYRLSEIASRPPAAVIADHDTRIWMARHPQLGRFVTAHYLPLWRDLWLPGLSARLSPTQPVAEWIVPADGTYRVFASRRLSQHPWFRQRVAALTNADAITINRPPLLFSQPLQGNVLTLRKSQRLRCVLTAADQIGVMLIRERQEEMFQQPPSGVTLEASSYPRWHVPDLSALAYSR